MRRARHVDKNKEGLPKYNFGSSLVSAGRTSRGGRRLPKYNFGSSLVSARRGKTSKV
jgi:hypothetical protein